jgi:hypothetical protein
MTQALAGAGNDSTVLAALLASEGRCLTDRLWLDQVIRLMGTTRQPAAARDLLDRSNRRRTLPRAEHEALSSWVTLAESRQLDESGDDAAASRAVQSVRETALRLRAEWPEWDAPYQLLAEADSRLAGSATTAPTDWYAEQQSARRAVVSGGAIRMLDAVPFAILVFVIVLAGVAVSLITMTETSDVRALMRARPMTIASAPAGRVALTGTLHRDPEVEPLRGPGSGAGALWTEVARTGMRDPTAKQYSRSNSRFALRDASGEVTIEPGNMRVFTTHVASTIATLPDATGRPTLSERLLREGDRVTVIGTLTGVGAERRVLRSGATAGDRLLLSNLDTQALGATRTRWLGAAAAAATVCLLLLTWVAYHRYLVAGPSMA